MNFHSLLIYGHVKFKYFLQTQKIKVSTQNVFLLNTPQHGNLGDQAIAVSSMKILKKICPRNRIIEISQEHYLNDLANIKKKVLKENVLLIQGGGYLGDLWRNEQDIVNSIIMNFPNNKIIILPQTVYYKTDRYIRTDFSLLHKHHNLFILARDKMSYDLMIEKMEFPLNRIHYVPDMVLALRHIRNYSRDGILFCLRKDKEKNTENNKILYDLETMVKRDLKCSITYTDTVLDHSVLAFDREIYLDDKLEQFSKHKLIITDRLHGMLFAYITQTPCIALDNISHKISGTYEWIKGCKHIKCISREQDLNYDELSKIYNSMGVDSFKKDISLEFKVKQSCDLLKTLIES